MTDKPASGFLTTAEPHLTLRRVERQHLLIEELCARTPRRITGARLAELLEVAPRTIERDIARLRDAGIPIDVRTGPGGGYAITITRHLASVQLTSAETAALLAALVAIGPSSSATARTAMAKLLAALHAQPT